MTEISVVIPCYEYHGKGEQALAYLFETLLLQTFQGFNVVVSDHSLPENREIENLCNQWSGKLRIKYLKNDYNRGNAASNFNYGMFNADGELIKFMCQDDYFYDELSLERTLLAFQKNPD